MGVLSQRSDLRNKAIAVVMAVLMLVALTPVVPAQAISTVWYVDVVNGDDGNAGTAAEPFKTITAGLMTAQEGDTVMVAPGTYLAAEAEPIPFGVAVLPDGEVFPLEVPVGVTLTSSGGSEVTIIDGELRADRSLIGLNMADNVTVEGFSLVNGWAEYAAGAHVMASGGVVFRDVVFQDNYAFVGGGMVVESSSISLESCSFLGQGMPERENEVEPRENGTGPYYNAYIGGGLIGADSELTLHDCNFSGNVAVVGGASALFVESTVEVYGGTVAEGYITAEEMNGALENLSVQELSEQPAPSDSWIDRGDVAVQQLDLERYWGGGFAFVSSLGTVHGTGFFGNGAPKGGAIFSDTYSDLTVSEAAFEDNFAIWGSGISRGETGMFAAEVEALDLSIQPQENGPMYEPGLFVEKSIFAHNWLADTVVEVSRGYSEPLGIAQVAEDFPVAEIVNSLFHDNEIAWSVIAAENTAIMNSTFADNMHSGLLVPTVETQAINGGYYGPSTVSVDASSTVTNGIFWGNAPDLDYGNGDPIPQVMLNTIWADVVGGNVSYTNAEYMIYADHFGDGNISEDPLFVSSMFSDYRLRPGSPSIDTGTNDGAPADDLLGALRPYDGDFSGMAVTDMGAYEYMPEGAVRLGGGDRYDTSVQISRDNFEFAPVVFIARGDSFADALTASGLAGLYNAPLLLTRPTSLPPLVAEEIERLGAEHAIIIGGPLAVSDDVEAEIVDMGLSTERIGGMDRYQTAELIADEIASQVDEVTLLFAVRGDKFPDALSVSPVAYAQHAPILLARPSEMPESGIEALPLGVMTTVVVVGGEEAVSPQAEEDIRAAGLDVIRVAGSNRYETSALFSEKAVEMGWARYDFVGMATGRTFPDALAGGTAIGSRNGVLMLTAATSLNSEVERVLGENKAAIFKVDVFGGPAALSDAVKAAIQAAIDMTG